MEGEKLQTVKLTEEQQEAINAICTYNNFALMSEGADGLSTLVLKASMDVIENGLRDLATHPIIREMMTNIVIDIQNESK